MSGKRWQNNLLITVAMIVIVFVGLLSAQLESVGVDTPVGTEIAVGNALTATPSPAVEVVPIPTLEPTVQIKETAVVKLTNTPIPNGEMPCEPPPQGWQHQLVGQDDTIVGLSMASGATVEEIVQYNCLGSRAVMAGMTIYLPITPPTRQPCGNPPVFWRPYTIKRGDTMFSLARFRGVTVYDVLIANCLSSTALKAGETILLPPNLVMTMTPLPTDTATPLPTETATAVSPTATPTEPATSTPPAFPTATATAVSTNTPTPTQTATVVTPTPSGTPTATSTPVPTSTNTPTTVPTEAATATPTNTPVPTATNTPAP